MIFIKCSFFSSNAFKCAHHFNVNTSITHKYAATLELDVISSLHLVKKSFKSTLFLNYYFLNISIKFY